MITIKGTAEKRTRGFLGFPFEIYRNGGSFKGAVIAPAHYHNELEIMLPQTGKTDLVIEGNTLCAQPENIYIINPGEVHAMYCHTDSFYYCLVFPKELLLLQGESIVNSRIIQPLFEGQIRLKRNITDKRCIELIKEISILEEDKKLNSPLILGKLYELFWNFEKQGCFEKTKTAPKAPIYRALDYMEENLDKKLTLKDIADKASLSPKYFCQYFKAYTGLTVIGYLNALRFKRAMYLLKNTNYSVLETALLCGYDNVSFFIKKFKEATGLTPAKYRKSS